MILSRLEVKNYLYNAGFKGFNLEAAINICFCESGFNTNAHNTTGEDSRGLMQINVNAHPYYSGLDLFNPQINCNCAFEIFTRAGNKFTDWSCANTIFLKNPMFFIGAGVAFLGIAVYIYAAR